LYTGLVYGRMRLSPGSESDNVGEIRHDGGKVTRMAEHAANDEVGEQL